MTAIATTPKQADIALKPVHFVGIILAVLMLGAYFVLPFVHQPELGPTTARVLTAERGNNEFDIETNGLELIPVASAAILLLGVWNVLVPQVSRAIAVLIAASGMLALLYFVIFFRHYLAAEEAAYLSAMGPAFWAMFALCGLAVLQVAIPRQRATIRQYQLSQLLGNQESVLLIGLIAIFIIVGFSNPRYLAERNITQILAGNAYIAVAAIGMSMVIITGNIDISVGSLIGLLAVVSGSLVVDGGQPVWVGWIAPLILGGLFGAFLGFIVSYLRVPSIVVTLGMLSILKGILILWRAGERVTDLPEAFFLAQQRPAGIPITIIIMVVLTALAALWLRYSATGRSFYAFGGNKEAARLSGLSERRIVMQAFILNGIFAGIASVMYATQLTIIQATPPPALELVIITASVVGGVSILGGTGTVIGSTLAAILLNAIQSSLVFVQVSQFWAQAIRGTLILITVLVDLIRRRRQRV